MPIEEGYRPGLLGRVTQLHALYYSAQFGFGSRFEAVVAGGLAEFAGRLDRPANRIWAAVENQSLLGAVAIDGEDLGEGVAHLRWFIVADEAQGRGVGRSLLARALDFVDLQGFARTDLWTFRGLDAARRLYESLGFICVEEAPGDRWGRVVSEQRFTRPTPGYPQ